MHFSLKDCQSDIILMQVERGNTVPFLCVVDLSQKQEVLKLFSEEGSLPVFPIYTQRTSKKVEALNKCQSFSFSLSHSPNSPQVFGYLPEVSSKPVPFVCYLHGGPFAASQDYFSDLTANLLLEGFAVMKVNYRGSFGFGKDFQDSLIGQSGRADVDDCVEAILRLSLIHI